MSGDVQTKYPPGFKSLSASIRRRPSIPCNMNVNKSQGAKILIFRSLCSNINGRGGAGVNKTE